MGCAASQEGQLAEHVMESGWRQAEGSQLGAQKWAIDAGAALK